MTIKGGSRAVRVGSLVRRARRGGREVSFVVLVHQDHEKRKKKKGKHGVFVSDIPGCHLRTSASLSCGSPQGHWFAEGIFPPFEKCWFVRHSLHLAAISSWCVTRSSCRSARRGIEPSRVPRRDGRRSMGRVFADDEETRPRVRERSRTRLSSRGRFRGATRFRRLAREASTAARSPVSAGDSARARRRRARLGLDEVSRGMGKRVPSEESSNQRADNLRAKFALWSMFSRFGLQSFGRGIRTRVNNSCRDLWDHRPTRVSAVFPFFSGAPKRCVRTRG